MKVIRPVNVLPGDIVSTTAVETVAAYNAGTTYATGNQVLFQDFIYLSLQDGNTGNTPDTSPTFWQQIGPSNRYAMFDTTVSTQTTGTSPLVVVVELPAIINTLALLNITGATSVEVELRDVSMSPPDLVYEAERNLDASIVTDWYQYFFAEFENGSEAVFTDVPPYGTAELTIRLIGPATVGVGLAQIGNSFFIGDTQRGVSVGIRDYSVKDTDQFGNTMFVERAFSKRMNPLVFMDNGRINPVFRVLSSLRATPTVFIGSEADDFESLIVYGFLKDWNIEIAYPRHSLVSIDVEGLI